MTAPKDRVTIRELASRWRDLASLPAMAERKRQWKAVHDLRAERPMILVETPSIEGFVDAAELRCTDPCLRGVESILRDTIRHAEELGDDVVVEPYYRLGWQMELPGFGVPVEQHHAHMADDSSSLGYSFNFPITTPAEVSRLERRRFGVNREKTLALARTLEDLMGDILPVRVGNYDHFSTEPGNEGWTGTFFFGLTWQIFRFIGNIGLLYWLYDAPDAIHRLMDYMVADRTRLFDYMEREGLLTPNTDNQMAGPCSYGYVSALPGPREAGPARLKDLWAWAESQETTAISPAMFREFVLPSLAALASRFGLVYYGCCEPVHDRLDLIMAAIPNLRSVSVSGWSDSRRVAEMLGKRYVFSRKPTPAYLSGASPNWDLVVQDMQKTAAAARDCNVEVLFRDIYTINGDWPRLSRWVAMTRAAFGM
jgi:hypothetical protein